MFKLILLALRNNWSAHKANPVNLFMGTAGMLFNNVLFMSGFFMMIFSGKSENHQFIPLYLACQVISLIAWGGLNFAASGFRELGSLIESGEFENYLASPRSSLLLAGISRSDVTSFGDVLMGLAGLPFLAIFYSPMFALHVALASLISMTAMLATYVCAGTLAFFVNRGASLAEMVNFVTLSLTTYPAGAALSGRSRLMLFLTPALATALLPIQAVLDASLENYLLALACSVTFLVFSFWFYKRGVKNYQSTNYIFLKS